MKYLSIIFSLLALVALGGCSEENPATQNELLKNKSISWSDGQAASYEFLASGTLIAVGGEFPLEGYQGGSWEAISEDGSFKMTLAPETPDKYQIARMQSPLAQGAAFILESYEDDKQQGATSEHKITSHKKINKSHKSSAIHGKAITYITRYADDIYLLNLEVDDIKSKIKKVYTEGEMITNEVMVTNAQIWRNNPPIVLPKGQSADQKVESIMTLHYHNGETEKATFSTSGYRDNSSVVFEDAWF